MATEQATKTPAITLVDIVSTKATKQEVMKAREEMTSG